VATLIEVLAIAATGAIIATGKSIVAKSTVAMPRTEGVVYGWPSPRVERSAIHGSYSNHFVARRGIRSRLRSKLHCGNH
jgi:hypothetical protein